MKLNEPEPTKSGKIFKYLRVRRENLDILDWEMNESMKANALTQMPNFGLVKYIGDVTFAYATSNLIGVELNRWSPNASDGTLNNKAYFDAQPGKGYITQLKNIVKNVSAETSQSQK